MNLFSLEDIHSTFLKTRQTSQNLSEDLKKEQETAKVTRYQYYVQTGVFSFSDKQGSVLSTTQEEDTRRFISEAGNGEKLLSSITQYEKKEIDFLTFCDNMATFGVYYCTTEMDLKITYYYDKSGEIILAQIWE